MMSKQRSSLKGTCINVRLCKASYSFIIIFLDFQNEVMKFIRKFKFVGVHLEESFYRY